MDHRPRERLTCPKCASRVAGDQIRLTRSFPCPTCGSNLRVRRIYANTLSLASFAIAGVAGFLIGASGAAWLVFTIVAVVPISALMFIAFGRRARPLLFLAS